MARRLGAAVVLLAWLARGAVASRDPLRRLSSALGLEVLELDEVAPQKQHGVDAAGARRAHARGLRAEGAEASRGEAVSGSDGAASSAPVDPADGAPSTRLARLDHPRQLPRSLVAAFCVVAVIANGVFLVYVF